MRAESPAHLLQETRQPNMPHGAGQRGRQTHVRWFNSPGNLPWESPKGLLGGSSRLGPVHASEGKSTAQDLGPGAFLPECQDAKNRSEDWQKISEGAQLRGFKVAQQPVIKDIRDGRAEQCHVENGCPSLPGNGPPVPRRTQHPCLTQSKRKDHKSARKVVVGGHR